MDVNLINKLFRSLRGIYPAWKQAFDEPGSQDAAKQEWLKAFVQSGINTSRQIEIGLFHARREKSPFIPSVGQFMDWCYTAPESDGLPSVELAYDEAAKAPRDSAEYNWSHLAVFYAARATGRFDLRSYSRRQMLPRFTEHYEAICKRVRGGEILLKPEHVLLPPVEIGEKRYTTEECNTARDDVKGLFP